MCSSCNYLNKLIYSLCRAYTEEDEALVTSFVKKLKKKDLFMQYNRKFSVVVLIVATMGSEFVNIMKMISSKIQPRHNILSLPCGSFRLDSYLDKFIYVLVPLETFPRSAQASKQSMYHQKAGQPPGAHNLSGRARSKAPQAMECDLYRLRDSAIAVQ